MKQLTDNPRRQRRGELVLRLDELGQKGRKAGNDKAVGGRADADEHVGRVDQQSFDGQWDSFQVGQL